MICETLRDVLLNLEERGKLLRVSKSVDISWEVACLVKWMFQAVAERDRTGLWFQNVAGHDIPVVIGALGVSTEVYAQIVGVAPNEINTTWEKALLNPVAPLTVEEGACQEIILRNHEARLDRLPIPTWTPGKDIGPYITTTVVTSNARTRRQNIGFYRTRVRDAASVVANLNPGRQGFLNTCTWTDQGMRAPIAWVIGAHPIVQYAATANLPWGMDEIEVAGGVLGKPVQLVKAKSIELLVPADAEIVLEGEIYPGETDVEGPFGEFAGYMGPVAQKPVAHITAITHRKNPIYCAMTSQMPPSESTIVQSLTNAGVVQKMLRHDLGEYTVQDVYIDQTFGGLMAHAVIAMTPRYPGHAKKVGRMVADCTPIKRITIVDPDVDIRDSSHVEWAMNSRFDPSRDTEIIEDVFFPMGMDPSIRVMDGKSDPGSKIVIDATETIDAGPFSLPSKEKMDAALTSWREAGLPDFSIPKRARLRIERS
jgi:4-hydroxy-3-polyprenylbenzoate decarboxylase